MLTRTTRRTYNTNKKGVPAAEEYEMLNWWAEYFKGELNDKNNEVVGAMIATQFYYLSLKIEDPTVQEI